MRHCKLNILILIFICNFNLLANEFGFGLGGFSVGENAFIPSEMQEAEVYEYLASEANQDRIASEISFYIRDSKDYVEFGDNHSSKGVLDSFNLNDPKYHDLREKVLQKVAINLSTPMLKYERIERTETSTIFAPKVSNVLKSDKLETFKKSLQELGIAEPQNMENAQKLADVYLETKDNEEEFFKRVKAELPKEYLHSAIQGASGHFNASKKFVRLAVQTMIETDNIDENYLYSLLVSQIATSTLYENWKIEGLLPLILEHIDIDHKSHFGLYTDSILCSTVAYLKGLKNPNMMLGSTPYNNHQNSDVVFIEETQNKTKQQEEFANTVKRNLVGQIDHLLKLNSNIDQSCQNGNTPREELRDMALDNFINIKGTMIEESLFGQQKRKCHRSSGEVGLAQICLNLKVLNFLEKAERSNKEFIGRQENGKELQFVDSLGQSNGCTVKVFDKMMSRSGKGITTQVEMIISNPNFQSEYVISTSSKEEFKKSLQKLLNSK